MPVPATIPTRSLVTLLLVALCLSACTTRVGGKQTLEQANDSLRAENATLKARAKALESRNAELVAATAAAASTTATGFNASEVTQATPVITSVEIDRLSGSKGKDTVTFTAYVRTLDGLQRFTQGVGSLHVELLNASSTSLYSRTLSPTQLRDAYRSGFAGTNYVVAFPVDANKSAEIGLIRATFTDARTGTSTVGELKISK